MSAYDPLFKLLCLRSAGGISIVPSTFKQIEAILGAKEKVITCSRSCGGEPWQWKRSSDCRAGKFLERHGPSLRAVSTISSRRSGVTCSTAHPRDSRETNPGRKYRVRMETAPIIWIRWRVFSGIQSAKCGGISHAVLKKRKHWYCALYEAEFPDLPSGGRRICPLTGFLYTRFVFSVECSVGGKTRLPDVCQCGWTAPHSVRPLHDLPAMCFGQF